MTGREIRKYIIFLTFSGSQTFGRRKWKPSAIILPAGNSPFPKNKDCKMGANGTSEVYSSWVSLCLLLGGVVEDHGRQSDCALLSLPHDKPHPFNSRRNHEGLARIKAWNGKVFVRSWAEKSHVGESVVDYFQNWTN